MPEPRMAVPSYDAGRLRRIARRTRIVRISLLAATVGFALAAAASARELDVRQTGPLAAPGATVVIVDLSLSIDESGYRFARDALRRIVQADSPIGLVVFSDAPYELLPPGTPARELLPTMRVLARGKDEHPWSRGFRAGTKISEAVVLARTMLERDGVDDGSIVLISDLETAPDDYNSLARELETLRAMGIPLRTFALSPSSDARTLFRGVEELTKLPGSTRARDGGVAAGGGVPVTLVVFGVLCLASLGAHERYGARLALPRRATRSSS